MHASMVLIVTQALELNGFLWLDDGVLPPLKQQPLKLWTNHALACGVLVRKSEREREMLDDFHFVRTNIN